MRSIMITALALTVLAPATALAGRDLTFSAIDAEYDDVNDKVDITLTVRNIGDTWVTPKFYIDLYAIEDGDWAACDNPDVQVQAHTAGLAPGASQDFVFTVDADEAEGGSVFAYVDLDDKIDGEDDEDNNAAVVMVVNENLPGLFVGDVPVVNPACLQDQWMIIPAAEDKIVAVIPEFP